MALIAGLIAISLSADPQGLVLGKDPVANLVIEAPAEGKLTLTANLGTVTAPRRDGDVFRARYTPPAIKFPSVALLLAQLDVRGERELAWLSIPLTGADTMVIETRAGSRVLADVAGSKVGPVTADEQGLARLRMVVPPGVQKATLHITDPLGNSTDKPLDLDPPPFSRLRMAPRHETAAAGDRIELEVFVVRPDGRPDDEATLDLKPSEGEAEVRRRIGPGTYLVRYTPPAGKRGTERVEVKAGAQRVSLEMPVNAQARPASPGRGSLRSREPWGLSAGVLAGGGATFDGAGAGTIVVEVATRVKDLPIEVLVDGGGAFYSEQIQYTGTPNRERARSRAWRLDLGLRFTKELWPGLDGHATALAGAQNQSISRTLYNQTILENDAWTPRFAFALGANLALGPGRALAQVQIEGSGSGTAGLVGSLGGVQLFAGYLVTIR